MSDRKLGKEIACVVSLWMPGKGIVSVRADINMLRHCEAHGVGEFTPHYPPFVRSRAEFERYLASPGYNQPCIPRVALP